MKSSSEFLSSIRVVAFDFDNTLVNENLTIRERWGKTLKQFTHLSDKLEHTFFSIFESKGQKYRAHVNDTLQELKLPSNHVQSIVDVFRSIEANEYVFEGVREAVSLLKEKGFRVGIITDGRKDYQENRLKKTDLYKLFDFFYYGDIYQKPDPAFFRSCIESEKISPQQFLYIGDDVKKDIEGAVAVGAKACLIGGKLISGESGQQGPLSLQEALHFKTMYNFLEWLHQK